MKTLLTKNWLVLVVLAIAINLLLLAVSYLFGTSPSGNTRLELYLWAEGRHVADTVQPWFLVGTVASVIATIVGYANKPDSDSPSDKFTSLMRSAGVAAIVFFGLAIATALMPRVETCNFIAREFNGAKASK